MTELAGGELCLPQRPHNQVGAVRRRRIMEDARVIRSQCKKVLGRHLNTLSRFIVEEDVNGANVRLASMEYGIVIALH